MNVTLVAGSANEPLAAIVAQKGRSLADLLVHC
jgi:hypothetical protein